MRKKELLDNLMGKLRALLVMPSDPQHNKEALPPKARFSIWYFVITMLFMSFTCSNISSPEKWKPFPIANLDSPSAKAPIENVIIGPENIRGSLKGSPARAFTTVRVDGS